MIFNDIQWSWSMTHWLLKANPTIQNASMTQLFPLPPLDERVAKWFGHLVKWPKTVAKRSLSEIKGERLDATSFIKSIGFHIWTNIYIAEITKWYIWCDFRDVLTNKTTKNCSAFDMKSPKSRTGKWLPHQWSGRWKYDDDLKKQWISSKNVSKSMGFQKTIENLHFTLQTCLMFLFNSGSIYWSFPLTVSQCHEEWWFLLFKTCKFPWCPTGARRFWAPGQKHGIICYAWNVLRKSFLNGYRLQHLVGKFYAVLMYMSKPARQGSAGAYCWLFLWAQE